MQILLMYMSKRMLKALCLIFPLLAELNILNESDSLLVLIPSSTVTSYEFEENKSLSKQINIANFISEVDSVFC